MTSSSRPAPATPAERPPLLERTGYAVSALSTNSYWQLFMMLQLYFYTDVFGITAGQAGVMFLVTRLWDAINDPIVGVLADKTHTRWGRYRPWLLWTALPFGLLGVAAFTTPPLDGTGRLIYAYISYSLLGMAYTAVQVPLNSLLGLSSKSSLTRTTLASWSMFGAFVAALVAQLFTLRLVEVFGGVEPAPLDQQTDVEGMQAGFQRVTLLYSAIAVAALLYAFFTLKERVLATARDAVPVVRQLKDMLTSRAWLVILGVFLMMCLFISIRGASQVYFMKYYLQVQGEVDLFGFAVTEGTAIGIYLALGSVGCLIGTPLMTPLARLMGKRNLFMGMLAVSALLALLHYPLGRDAVALAFVLQLLVGLFSGPLFILKSAMLADIADELELAKGYRSTGLVFSAASFSFKFGWTLGGSVAAAAPAWYGFEANVEPSPETVDGIRLMMSFLPMVPMAAAAGLLLLYPLTDTRVAEIEAELEVRRGEHAAADAAASVAEATAPAPTPSPPPGGTPRA